MPTNVRKTSAIAFAAALSVLAILQISTHAQKSAPVTVTNTTANPVPVTGGVAVTNTGANPVPVAVIGTPMVNAAQDGTWNVGITSMPKVQLDQDQRVQITRNTIANVESFNWTGQQSVFSFQFAAQLDKIRLCVANGGPNTVVANVNTLIADTQFNIDQFQVSSSVVCRVYDAPGYYLYVTVFNTGANTTGNVRVGYWGLY